MSSLDLHHVRIQSQGTATKQQAGSPQSCAWYLPAVPSHPIGGTLLQQPERTETRDTARRPTSVPAFVLQSWTGKMNTANLLLLLKIIYKFSAIPIKNPSVFLKTQLNKANFWRYKELQRAKFKRTKRKGHKHFKTNEFFGKHDIGWRTKKQKDGTDQWYIEIWDTIKVTPTKHVEIMYW